MRKYKFAIVMFAALLAGRAMPTLGQTPLGTAVTYQGQLKENGSPHPGPSASMQFDLYNDPNVGTSLGTVGPLTAPITDGLFTVPLDFLANAFDGNARWLEITVDGSLLTPRQEITAAPASHYSLAPWTTEPNGISYMAGNVGIGTTDPNAALQIDTATFFDLSSTPTGQDNLLLTDVAAGAGDGNVMASIGFGNGDTSRRAAIAALQTGNSLHRQGLAFYTHPSTVGGDDIKESMRIEHNGNVGIGTTNPSANLEISSGAGGNGDAVLKLVADTDNTGEDDNPYLMFGQDGQSDLGFLGLVGSAGIAFDGQAVTDSRANALLLYHRESQPIQIGDNGIVAMTIEDGDVGIGTTDPKQKLHVADGNIRFDKYGGGSPTLLGHQANGTEALPTRTMAGDDLMRLAAKGHGDSNIFSLASRARIFFTAAEDWTDDYQGTYLAFETTENLSTATTERMRIADDGNVGIGTPTPNSALQIDTDTVFDLSSTPSGQENLLLTDNVSGSGQHNVFASIGFGNNENSRRAAIAALQSGDDGDRQGLAFYTHPSNNANNDLEEKMRLKHNGNLGIGTNNPATTLHVDSNDDARIRVSLNENKGADMIFNMYGPGLVVYDGAGQPAIQLLGANGTTQTKILQVTGADLAEKFPFSGEAQPGMVVQIDPDHPGKLRVARGAYNRRVAGVVSGANDLSAGVILGNLPGQEDAPPIALSGRVWAYCDASEQPIEPGDLLTTSDTPGHAMKVTDHPKAQGAIIGKAMSGLESGEGLVLVLVSLQ